MHWTMYVLPLGSVYGVFGGKGQRSLPVGVVAAVEEGTTGTVVVPGGTGVVGPPGVDPPGVDTTGVDPTGVDPTDVGPIGVDDEPGVVGTPGVVDTIGVVGATEAVGSTGLVAGLVPVLVSTTMEPSEFIIVIAVVKVFGVVD